MKRFMLLLLCLVLVLFQLNCGDSKEEGISDEDVAAAKTEVDSAETSISSGNFSDAKTNFEEALTHDPTNGEANFMLAVLDIVYLVENDNIKEFYKKFGADATVVNNLSFNKLVEDDYANKSSSPSKFSVPSRDELLKSLLNVSSKKTKVPRRTANKQLSTMLKRTAASISRASKYPGVSYPTMTEIKTLISGTILPVLEKAVTRLKVIESRTEFSYPIKKSWFPIDDDDVPETIITLNKAHVYALHAYLDSVISGFYVLLGYNIDPGDFEYYETLSDTTENDDEYIGWTIYRRLFVEDNDFFTVENQAYFTKAQEYFVSFLGNTALAVKNVDLDDTIGDVYLQDAAEDILDNDNVDFYVNLIEEISNDIVASFQGTKVFTITGYDFFPAKGDGFTLLDELKNRIIDVAGLYDANKYWDAIKIDFSKLFTAPITRADLPQITYNNGIKIVDIDAATSNLQVVPDPTFNGLFPGITRELIQPLEGMLDTTASVTFVNETSTDYYVDLTGSSSDTPSAYTLVSANSTTTVSFTKDMGDEDCYARFKLSSTTDTIEYTEYYNLYQNVRLTESANVKVINSSNVTIYVGLKSDASTISDTDLTYTIVAANSSQVFPVTKKSVFDDDEDVSYVILKKSATYDYDNVVKTGQIPYGGTLNYLENTYNIKFINDSSKTVYIALDDDWSRVLTKTHSSIAAGVTATYQVTLSAPDAYFCYNIRTTADNQNSNNQSELSVFESVKIIDDTIKINNYSNTDVYIAVSGNSYSDKAKKIPSSTTNYNFSVDDGITTVKLPSSYSSYHSTYIYYGIDTSSYLDDFYYHSSSSNDSISFYGPKTVSVTIANYDDTEYIWQILPYNSKMPVTLNDTVIIGANETQTVSMVVPLYCDDAPSLIVKRYYYSSYSSYLSYSTYYGIYPKYSYEYVKKTYTRTFDNIRLVNNLNESFYYDIEISGSYDLSDTSKIITANETKVLSGSYSVQESNYQLYAQNQTNSNWGWRLYIKNTNSTSSNSGYSYLYDNREYYVYESYGSYYLDYNYISSTSTGSSSETDWSETWWKWMK